MKKLFVLALAAFAGLSLQAQTFGRVNFSELVALMPEMDQAREVIAASQKEAEETYSAMLEEFQSKYSQYQQKQATWTAAIKESKERELSDMQTNSRLPSTRKPTRPSRNWPRQRASPPSSTPPRLSTSMSPR